MKYKLIKKYPGLPGDLELGSIVEKDGPLYREKSTYTVYSEESIENFPEFWEPVEEKEYEIQSYKYKAVPNIWRRQADGRFAWGSVAQTEEELIVGGGYDVHSVKRLSDGTVFTVGDKITGKYFTISPHVREIKEMYFDRKGELEIRQTGGYSTIDTIELYKKPLFTTADGVEIHEGEDFFCIDGGDYSIRQRRGGDGLHYHEEDVRKRCFSTRQAADDNIPRYSREDIRNAWEQANPKPCAPFYEPEILISYLDEE